MTQYRPLPSAGIACCITLARKVPVRMWMGGARLL